jgi:hypothetical protein
MAGAKKPVAAADIAKMLGNVHHEREINSVDGEEMRVAATVP